MIVASCLYRLAPVKRKVPKVDYYAHDGLYSMSMYDDSDIRDLEEDDAAFESEECDPDDLPLHPFFGPMELQDDWIASFPVFDLIRFFGGFGPVEDIGF